MNAHQRRIQRRARQRELIAIYGPPPVIGEPRGVRFLTREELDGGTVTIDGVTRPIVGAP